MKEAVSSFSCIAMTMTTSMVALEIRCVLTSLRNAPFNYSFQGIPIIAAYFMKDIGTRFFISIVNSSVVI